MSPLDLMDVRWSFLRSFLSRACVVLLLFAVVVRRAEDGRLFCLADDCRYEADTDAAVYKHVARSHPGHPTRILGPPKNETVDPAVAQRREKDRAGKRAQYVRYA